MEREKWDRNEKTLSVLNNFIELIYKKLKDYNACIASDPFKDDMLRLFGELYGLKWEKMNNCP